jgi:hypothetical protein
VLTALTETKLQGNYQQWIDVSGLQPGIYVATLKSDGIVLATRKLVKQ